MVAMDQPAFVARSLCRAVVQMEAMVGEAAVFI
jgi:hypothetical protein